MKRKNPLKKGFKKMFDSRNDDLQELWEMFNKQCQKNRESSNNEIVAKLLFCLILDIRGIRTLFSCLLGLLLGLIISGCFL